MLDIIERIVDGLNLSNSRKIMAKQLSVVTDVMNGWAVDIVANQRKIAKSKKGEMQMGGVISIMTALIKHRDL